MKTCRRENRANGSTLRKADLIVSYWIRRDAERPGVYRGFIPVQGSMPTPQPDSGNEAETALVRLLDQGGES